MRRASGLTLLETVLSFGLLATLLLGLMAFFTRFLSSTAKQDDLTAGVVFAQQQLDQAVLQNTYATSTAALQQGLYTHDTAGQTTFFYQLTSTPVPLPAPSTKTGYYLEVKVWWWSNAPGQDRAGVGKLSTQLSRLVTPP